MKIGPLRQRITLQRPVASKGASGGNVTTWVDVPPELWASVKNMGGTELRSTKHGGEVAEARTDITIRYRSGVTAEMRVIYNGSAYNIRHVNNWNEGNRFIILTCDTGVTP